MSCRVKDCSFISNSSSMLEYHMSSIHGQGNRKSRNSASKRKINQDSASTETNSTFTTVSTDSTEESVKFLASEDDPLPSSTEEKKPRLKRFNSPEKRPRNIKIGMENILKESSPTENFNLTDNVLIQLLLVNMFECTGHIWERVNRDDGKIDPKSSVLKTLILDHLGGCEHCQEIVKKNNRFKSKFDFTENHSVAFLKNQILCHLKHIEALKEEVRQLQSEIEGLSETKYDLCHSSYLPEVAKPRVSKDPSLSKPKGFRLIDSNLMGLALSNAQTCHHSNLILAENVSKNSQVGLATQLAFICQTCGDQTLFVSSSFNVEHPSNYTVNKLFLPKLGKTAFSTLSRHLSSSLGMEPISVPSQQRPKMFVSYVGEKQDSNINDNNPTPMEQSSFEPAKDKQERIHSSVDNVSMEQQDGNIKEDNEESSIHDFLQVKMEEPELNSEDVTGEPCKNILPDSENNTCDALSTTSDVNYLLEDSDSEDVTNDPNKSDNQPKLKLRSFSELQGDIIENHSNDQSTSHSWTQAEERSCEEMFYVLGGVASPIAPGCQVVSNNVRKTTCHQSGLSKGVYLFRKENCKDEILVVKEETPKSNTEVPINRSYRFTAKDVFKSTLNRVAGVSDNMFERFVTTKWCNLDSEKRTFYHYKAKKMNEMFNKSPASSSTSSSSEPELWIGNEGLPAGWSRKFDKIGQNKETGSPFLKVRIITPDNTTLHNKNGLKKYLAQSGLEGTISTDSIDFSPYRDPSVPINAQLWEGDEGLPQGWHRIIRKDNTTEKNFVEIVTPDCVTLYSKVELKKYLKLNGLSFLDPGLISFSPYKKVTVHDEDDVKLISKLDGCM